MSIVRVITSAVSRFFAYLSAKLKMPFVKVLGLSLVVVAILTDVLMTIVLLVGLQAMTQDSLTIINVFRELVFNVSPGFILIGLVLFFYDRINAAPKEKSDKLRVREYIFIAFGFVSFVVFAAAYSAPKGSMFYTVTSIIPSIGILAPDLRSITLWHGFFLLLTSAILLYGVMEKLGVDKAKLGAFLIGLLVSLFFALMLVRVPIFSVLEESAVSLRYSSVRNPGRELHPESGEPYCRAPYDDSGEAITVQTPPPPGIRDDIQIIGISNKTIEEVKGNWPLDWSIYGQLATRLGSAEGGIILFDISFLDEKGVFGGGYCDVLFKCTSLGAPLRRQVDVLAEGIASAKGIVVSDYPMETTNEGRSSISNYETRMSLMDRKNRLKYIKNGAYAPDWARLPVPPVESVLESIRGAGFANIIKNQTTGINRHVPLIARVVNMEKREQPGYNPDIDDAFYPNIDLLLAAEYYGVDPIEDIEVDFLAGYVLIKNIPEKTFEKVNLQTFEMEVNDIMAKPNASRSIRIPMNQTGLMNINFRGGLYCFKFREILATSEISTEQAEANFKGMISLVAMYYATGVSTAKDVHLSPYGDMAGIEHHAYALNTILNQDFAHDVPDFVNLMILLGIGILMGLYQPRVPTWMSFILMVGIAIIYSLVTINVTFRYFSLLHVYPTVLVQQFVILAGFIGFRALAEEENVKFIRNTFSKFVSQDVVDELLANPEAIALGGAKKEISVFFSDVRGFTTISEQLGPEDLVHLLNEYLSAMTELIIEYRGTIDKYMGDAIMAFWGAPAKNDDHAYYTCVAALAQARKLIELQQDWSTRGIPVLDIGIGLNTGQAVVGNMGSSRRMDYTLMGDTVNLGSRLEGVTKQYGVKICISEFTYERVKDRVYARELDLIKVKGKLQPVRIYELMGLVNDDDIENFKVQSVKK